MCACMQNAVVETDNKVTEREEAGLERRQTDRMNEKEDSEEDCDIPM